MGPARRHLPLTVLRLPLCAALPQVLKGQLALLAPSLSCGAFFYEEGEDLEEDEVRCACRAALRCAAPRWAGRHRHWTRPRSRCSPWVGHRRPAPPSTGPQVAMYRALLPRPLAALPGGGLVGGSIVEVSDQEQQFKAQLVLAHRVGAGHGWARGGAAMQCARGFAQQIRAPRR